MMISSQAKVIHTKRYLHPNNSIDTFVEIHVNFVLTNNISQNSHKHTGQRNIFLCVLQFVQVNFYITNLSTERYILCIRIRKYI
jgi:hypothetical protein